MGRTTREKVVLRVYSSGVFALFPEIPTCHIGNTCKQYAQHTFSTADPKQAMKASRPATTAESIPLLEELTTQGFTLKVIQHITSRHTKIRRAIASALSDMGDSRNPESRNKW